MLPGDRQFLLDVSPAIPIIKCKKIAYDINLGLGLGLGLGGGIRLVSFHV